MSAVQEDVDAIGLSIHSAAHMTLFGEVMRLLKENNATDMVVFGGGIVPEEDIGKLKRMGVREIFTPGASLEAIVNFVSSIGIKRPKARRSKQESIPSFAVLARVGGKSRNQAKQKSSA
jgi:methylmalonyl-CoA mutase cobalamin-binding domain/chain